MTHQSRRSFWILMALTLIWPGIFASAQPDPQERRINPQDRPAHIIQFNEITAERTRVLDVDAPAMIPNHGLLAFRQDGEPELMALPPSIRDLKWRLPIGVIQMVDDNLIQQTLQGEALLVGGWLMADGEVFSGILKIRLADLQHPESTANLEQEISLVVTAERGETSPTGLIIKKVNTYTDVLISTPLDPPFVQVDIIPAFNASPMHLRLPVMRRLILRSTPQSVQGFGLESARISVSIKPPPEDPIAVILSSDFGQLDPPEVMIRGAEPQFVTLRSQGTGSATVRAEASLTSEDQLEVDFVFPVNFLVAALIGGLLGSIVRVRNKMDDQGKIPWVSFIVTGLITGLIAATVFMLGFNPFIIPLVAKFGEALVFFIACLGGFVGSPLLSFLSRLRSS